MVISWNLSQFLLTRLLRGATFTCLLMLEVYYISTHTPLARRDCVDVKLEKYDLNFYSHASCEARRVNTGNYITDCANFYSHASCEARPVGYTLKNTSSGISTHTPLARRDLLLMMRFSVIRISTHTPLARRDRYI